MGHSTVTEGLIPFTHSTLPKQCWTWYQTHGDLKNSSTRPLVVLHGGPGSCHNYLLSLVDLAENHGIPVVFYDQLGCGRSTRLREKRLDESFWTTDLFVAELDNLLSYLGIDMDFDLLGQSWGGMLASSLAIRGHVGLNRLVVSNSPASLNLWVAACNRSREQLPRDVDETLDKYESVKDYKSQEYKNACMVWNQRYMCRVNPWPDYVLKSFELMDEDDTVYFTMNGPSEFTVIGSLRNYDLSEKVKNITVPTLVLNGEYDAADSSAIAPFLEDIEHVESHTFTDCSHMCHVEKRDEYTEVVASFLGQDKS